MKWHHGNNHSATSRRLTSQGLPPSGTEIQELSNHIYHMIGILQEYQALIRGKHEPREVQLNEMEYTNPGRFRSSRTFEPTSSDHSVADLHELSKNIHYLVDTLENIKSLVLEERKIQDQYEDEHWGEEYELEEEEEGKEHHTEEDMYVARYKKIGKGGLVSDRFTQFSSSFDPYIFQERHSHESS
ncbi:hypothetical protein RF11_11334 [Thelohanellus kitauei]|uniref:Uncharacterized protein n=1 Tax=Thelohanellus kitauei TaxID=669202 RepID=A0A0C2JBU6_THEKT|nr:hypothetical protein RF11_11334 [Thelohanellus kitauei]